MSRAPNLDGWDVLWDALEQAGAWAHTDPRHPRPEYDAVRDAMDELSTASNDRMTYAQIVCVARLIEAASKAIERSNLKVSLEYARDRKALP